MKLAAMNYHYLRYSLSCFLDKIERSPLDCIELYASAPQMNIFDYPLSRLIEIDREIRKRKLEIICITPENCVYPINFASQEKELRDSSLRYYQRVLDTAQFMGCGRVQLCLGYGYFDQPKEEAWKLGRDSLEQLAVYAERKHITLLLEELMRTTSNVINSSAELAKMLQEIDSPNVAGMMDCSQMAWFHENPDDYFGNLGGRLQHIHFNDRGHLVPGNGDLPMKDYYEAIRRHGYQGTMSFEICDRRYYCDPDRAIDDTLRWFADNTEELGTHIPDHH